MPKIPGDVGCQYSSDQYDKYPLPYHPRIIAVMAPAAELYMLPVAVRTSEYKGSEDGGRVCSAAVTQQVAEASFLQGRRPEVSLREQ